MKRKPSKTFVVAPAQAGRSLLDTLQAALRLSRKEALSAVQARGVRLAGRCCTEPRRQVKAGQSIEVVLKQSSAAVTKPGGSPGGTVNQRPPRPAAPVGKPEKRLPAIKVRHVDAHLVVVEKPAGLTTVRHEDEKAAFGQRAQKFLPTTLIDWLPDVLKGQGVKIPGYLRAVHRLDKETSGLLVVARTPAAESALGGQFRAHTVGRTYLALVRGRAEDATIASSLVRDRGDGRRGSSAVEGEGQHGVTHVRVVKAAGDYTLVECRLETGRTHQVRIHLGEAGTPLCGEKIYDRPPHGSPLPDGSGAKRPMLHAATLSFDHPDTGKRLEFTSPMPVDMKALKERLLPSKEGRKA